MPLATVFSVILDDFRSELSSLEQLMGLGQATTNSARVRIASINAVTLLLAATFEEFVRQMALENARQTVDRASELSEVPEVLLETAWRRTLDDVSKSKVQRPTKRETIAATAAAAYPKLDALRGFLDGDIGQDIFDTLIHNENNMRGGEINSLFKVSGTSNVCQKICDEGALKSYLVEQDVGKVGGQILQRLEAFFERRNTIAHSLNAAASASPDSMREDLRFFKAVAEDLTSWLDKGLQPAPAQNGTIEAGSQAVATPKIDLGNYVLSWLKRLFRR